MISRYLLFLSNRFRLIALLAAMLISLQIAPLGAQTPEQTLDPDVIRTRLSATEADTVLPEDKKASLIESYRQTLALLETANSANARFEQYVEVQRTGSQEVDRLKAETEQQKKLLPVEGPLMSVDADSKATDLRLQKEKAGKAAIEAKLASISQSISTETSRPAQISSEVGEASRILDESNNQLKSDDTSTMSARMAEAYRWRLTAQAIASTATIQKLDQELLTQGIRIEILEAEQALAKAKLDLSRQSIAILEQELQTKRQTETSRIIDTLDEIQLSQLEHAELILPYLERNQELKQSLQKVTTELDNVRDKYQQTETTLKDVSTAYEAAQQRLEVAGMNKALGRIMHEQRRDLPNINQLRSDSKQRAVVMADAGLRDIRIASELDSFANIDAYIDEILEQNPEADSPEIRGVFKEVIQQSNILLKSVRRVNNDYQRALSELEYKQQELIGLVEEADEFLNERLLWVRNLDPIGPKSILVGIREGGNLLFSAKNWQDIIRALGTGLIRNTFAIPGLILAGLLVAGRRKIVIAIRDTSAYVNSPASDSIQSTVKAMALTFLIALPLPLVLYVFSFVLIHSDKANAIAMGDALLNITDFLLTMQFVSLLCIKGGVAQAHFGWTRELCDGLRRGLSLLIVGFVLPALLLVYDRNADPSNISDQFGRIMFIVAVISFTVFTVRMLRPDNGTVWKAVERIHGQKRGGWFWAVVFIILPVSLIFAAVSGYMYAAVTLMSSLFKSIVVVTLLLLAHEFLSRWLLIVNRKMLRAQALEQQQADYEALLRKREGDEEVPEPEEPMIDLQSLDKDTRKLMNTGLLVVGIGIMSSIWSELIIALGFFREITLWTYVDGLPGSEVIVPVSLVDLIMAIFIAIVTYVSAKTIPSLIDVILRTRTNVTAGARLAYSTLVRYAIVIIGAASVSDIIGFQWGQIQWLVAALGVGIGFGLQEIVANFISGLIILVERPIRVGDVVTVGNVSGTVNRIQIRATTITNWDRQELLVPNREFIANQVLNWSLSDDVLRLVIKVGIAYGSDIQKALDIVTDVANSDSRILTDPAPFATFDEFGDNALQITLRAFVGTSSRRFETISDLNLEIEKRFNEAGIVIAFPQRDIHLDTSKPLDIRVSKADD